MPAVYLSKEGKQLLRFGLLYNIEVIEDSQTQREVQQLFFVERFVFIILVQGELFPVNCPVKNS